MGGLPALGDLAQLGGPEFEEDSDDEDMDPDAEERPPHIRGDGYTPWDFVELSEEQIKHEVGVRWLEEPFL